MQKVSRKEFLSTLARNDPEPHESHILELNALLNQLVDGRVGLDDGSHMPGSASL